MPTLMFWRKVAGSMERSNTELRKTIVQMQMEVIAGHAMRQRLEELEAHCTELIEENDYLKRRLDGARYGDVIETKQRR